MLVEEDSDITSNLVTSNTIQSKKNNTSRIALPQISKEQENQVTTLQISNLITDTITI